MIEPSKVLNLLKDSVIEEDTHKICKRPLEIFYSNDSLKDITTSLLYPSISDSTELELTQNIKRFKLRHSNLRLDLEYIKRISGDTRFFITPSETGLDYLEESLSLFESCLSSLPNFKLIDSNLTDTESYFKNLVESFFLFLDSESVQLDFNENNLDDFQQEDHNNLSNAEFKSEENRPVITQLFLSMILAYNWCMKLFEYTQTAFEISKWNLNECETHKILKTALGLREANRNYVFYNTVSQNLLNVLKSKDNLINSFVTEFMERVGFLNNIANSEMAYEPLSWNRIKVNFAVTERKSSDGSKNEHEENLNLIRSEMAKRMSGRSKCEYLRREVEKANSDMLRMESKNEEVLSKLEALKRQLNELPNTYKFESTSIGKLTDSKKLPRKLFDLLSHLNSFSQSNPLREINFKIVKDHSYSFQMLMLAPKDLLFPSLEATKFLFPLLFHFYLEEDNLRVKQVNNTKLSTSKTPVELVMNKFLGAEQEDDLDFGLDRFDDSLMENFHETMEKLYKLAQEFVWNLYVLESYKTNNKSILSKILPREFQDRTIHSKYTYREKSVWTLSNSACSVSVHVFVEDGTLKFKFSEFERTGRLENVEESRLANHLKKNGVEFDLESLSGMSQLILDYFNCGYELIHISVLFEAYSVIFDFLSAQ